jgi:hypothetical protein
MPGECICRTVMTVNSWGSYDREKAAELAGLLRDDGAYLVEQVNAWGIRCGLIAVRPASWGPFEMDTDLDSRIAEYRTRRRYHEGMGALWFSLGVVFGTTGMTIDWGSLGDALIRLTALVYWLIALWYWVPAFRYRKALKRLEAERDVNEA